MARPNIAVLRAWQDQNRLRFGDPTNTNNCQIYNHSNIAALNRHHIYILYRDPDVAQA
jgi:hypothetical protein